MTAEEEIIAWIRELFDHFEECRSGNCRTCGRAVKVCQLIRGTLFGTFMYPEQCLLNKRKSTKPERKNQK